MSPPEIAKISAEVSTLKQEVVDTKLKLERIKSEGSIWSEAGRQDIVRKCMESIEPSINRYISKFNSVADTLKRLGSLEAINPVKEEFKSILATIETALVSMENYGSENDKIKAKNLCSQIRGCQSKLG